MGIVRVEGMQNIDEEWFNFYISIHTRYEGIYVT